MMVLIINTIWWCLLTSSRVGSFATKQMQYQRQNHVMNDDQYHQVLTIHSWFLDIICRFLGILWGATLLVKFARGCECALDMPCSMKNTSRNGVSWNGNGLWILFDFIVNDNKSDRQQLQWLMTSHEWRHHELLVVNGDYMCDTINCFIVMVVHSLNG